MALTVNSDLNGGTGTPAVRSEHPLYSEWKPVWQRAAYVIEGAGPFLDGKALWAHPREWEDHTQENPVKPTKKLKARRAMARYENFAKLLVQQVSGALFRVPPQRLVGDQAEGAPTHPLALWWDDVDGRGRDMTTFLREAWWIAAAFGHSFICMDRTEDGRLYLTCKSPLDAPDWVLRPDGSLKGIKFVEIASERSLFQAPGSETYQYRYYDDEEMLLMHQNGSTLIPSSPHGFGRLPVVPLYTKRRPLIQLLGESLIGDPTLFYDVYNLTSEARELLRNQTFGILNVPLGTGDTAVSPDDAKSMMGVVQGTDQVLFTPQSASYLQPDSGNVTAYQTERDALIRTIFRLASVPWEGDSRAAESAESRKIKRDEFAQLLAGYADELQRAEDEIVDLWFAGTFGPERYEQEEERAQVIVRYPERFDGDSLEDVKVQATVLTMLGMPYEVKQAVQKRALPLLLPDATPQETQDLAAVVVSTPDPAVEQAKLLKDAQKQLRGIRPPA